MKMTIAKKLNCSFLIVSLLIVLVGYLGIFGIYKVKKLCISMEMLDHFYADIQELKIIISEQTHFSLHLVAFDEEESVKKFKVLGDDFKKKLSEVEKNSSKFGIKDAAGLCKDIRQQHNSFEKIFDRIVEDHKAGYLKTIKQKALAHEELCPAAHGIIEACRQIEVFYIKLHKEKYDRGQRTIPRIITMMILSALFMFVTAWMVGTYISKKISAPIVKLKDAAVRIGNGELAVRTEIKTEDEIETLASEFNHMAERLQASHATLEQKVRDRTKELDHIFRIAGDGMCVIDRDFNVVRVNETFEHIFDARRSETVGRKCYEIWEDSRCYTPVCTLTRLLAGEERVESEMVKKRTDGTSVPCIAVGTPMKDSDGKIKAVVTTYKDLTNLKTVQDQLLQSEKMAAIGQLAAGVAHEINNPVGFVSSNLRTLNEYRKDLTALLRTYMEIERSMENGVSLKENKELKKVLNAARDLKEKMDIEFVLDDFKKVISESREGTDRVKEIVADLKDFSHVDEHELTYADINKGLESTLNILWNELKYKTKVIKNLGELSPIACYPQQLNQVFMNILVNAAQAIEKQGEIVISTSALDGKVEIRISDTGKGIPEDVLPRIFEPFFTTKAVGEGTGLGLNMAYNIIKKHKGDIKVESTVGEGTTFIIEIPI